MEKIKLAKEFIKEFIRVREMRNIGSTVEDVVLYVKQTQKEWPFDMLVDDYGGKLSPKKAYTEMRHNYKHVWDTLDQISGELKIAVMTASQVNREAAKKNKKGLEIMRSEGVSECAAIAHISETIITLNRSAQDNMTDRLIVALDKGRDEQNGLLIQCKTHMSCILTHDPDYYPYEILGYDMCTSDSGGGK